MSRYRWIMTGREQAQEYAGRLTLRPDMAAQFEEEGEALPEGPIWTLLDGDRVLGLGGLKPSGSAASIGWLLVGEGVTVRDWVEARHLMRKALEWAACHAIRRVHACPEASMAGARRLLERLGFEPTGEEGGNIVMTKELI